MKDLNTVGQFLMSDRSLDGSVGLSDLDGFLHGVACSPEIVPMEEWLPVALGEAGNQLPGYVVSAVARHFSRIVEGLASSPAEIRPIVRKTSEGQVVATDWCKGFRNAVAMRRSKWLSLFESAALNPVAALFVNALCDPKLDPSVSAEKLPETVTSIHRFWLLKEVPSTRPLVRLV